jgi:hypothetical protein
LLNIEGHTEAQTNPNLSPPQLAQYLIRTRMSNAITMRWLNFLGGGGERTNVA